MASCPNRGPTSEDRDGLVTGLRRYHQVNLMRRLRFLLTPATILALLHVYIGVRVLGDLPLGPAGVAFGVGVLAVSWLSIPLAFVSRRLANRKLAERLSWLGSLAAGLFSSLFVLTL